jgi:hypothetical protein
VSSVVQQLRSILSTFKKQRKYKIFASSALIAYDAKAVKLFLDGKIKSSTLSKSVSVRIIDFAHVFHSGGERDDNFIFGLENILKLFENCLRK